MDNIKKYPYSRQYIDQDDINAVCNVLKQDIITRGKNVKDFENSIANYCGAKYAVAFSNGTAALKAAYFAADISPYDTIVSTPITFISTVTAAFSLQPKVSLKLIEVDPYSGNMNLDSLQKNLPSDNCSRGKTIIVPVHYAGNPINIQKIEYMIKNPHTIIIEDGAQALGASYSKSGPKVGSCEYSDMTIFSFHPTKSISAGEGGMITTNDEEIAKKLLLFRDNGLIRNASEQTNPTGECWYYEAHYATGNYHMSEMHAALGLSQFNKLETFIKKRRRILSWYSKELANSHIITPLIKENQIYGAAHFCPMLINFNKFKITRQQFMDKLTEYGIYTQVHYIPLYKQPIIKMNKDMQNQFKDTELFYSQILSFPVSYNLEYKDIAYICKMTSKILNDYKN